MKTQEEKEEYKIKKKLILSEYKDMVKKMFGIKLVGRDIIINGRAELYLSFNKKLVELYLLDKDVYFKYVIDDLIYLIEINPTYFKNELQHYKSYLINKRIG